MRLQDRDARTIIVPDSMSPTGFTEMYEDLQGRRHPMPTNAPRNYTHPNGSEWMEVAPGHWQPAEKTGGRSLQPADIRQIEHDTRQDIERAHAATQQHVPGGTVGQVVGPNEGNNWGMPRWASPGTRLLAREAATARGNPAESQRIRDEFLPASLERDRIAEERRTIGRRMSYSQTGAPSQGPARGPRGQELLQEDTGGGGAGRPQLQEDVPQNPLARQPQAQVDAVQNLAESLRRTGGPIIMPGGQPAPEDMPGRPLAGGPVEAGQDAQRDRIRNLTAALYNEHPQWARWTGDGYYIGQLNEIMTRPDWRVHRNSYNMYRNLISERRRENIPEFPVPERR